MNHQSDHQCLNDFHDMAISHTETASGALRRQPDANVTAITAGL